METLATLGIVDIAYVQPHFQWPELSGRWGTDEMAFCGRYDGLLFVRLTPLGAHCLRYESSYEMAEPESDGLVKVLPNFDLILANNAAPDPVTTARLEIFATRSNERVWKIDRARILAQIEKGGSMEEIRQEIHSLADGELPDSANTLLDEIDNKTNALGPGQACLLVEARDRETAALIAHDSGAAKCCYLAGERHLAVPKKNEAAFRAAVKKLGYVLPLK